MNFYRPSYKVLFILFFFLRAAMAIGQNETMYLMKSGFVEEEINVLTDVDSIILYDPAIENSSLNNFVLMKDGNKLAQYRFKTELDSVVFLAPAATAERALEMLEGIYWMLNTSQLQFHDNFFFASELASDERLGGGGADDYYGQAIDHLLKPELELFEANWNWLYKGIYRANALLFMLDEVEDFSSVDYKNQMMGEALFLRAFFLFQLTSLHGEIPVPLSLKFEPMAASPVTDIYAQIASDLKLAIEEMPGVAFNMMSDGRATKWAVEAFMARVFLFYTGFYQTAELPLKDGGFVSRNNVISWLADCVDNSGHQLVADFHELWAYTNHFTIDDYPYIQNYISAIGKPLKYASDYGARNPESLFAMKFSTGAEWDLDRARSNQLALCFGLRGLQGLEKTFPFAGGWGFGTVSPNLVDDWMTENPDDPRLWASVLDLAEEVPGYNKGQWQAIQETDYNQKKIIGVSALSTTSGRYVNNYSVLMHGNQDNMQLSHMTDIMLIRFADVLLMMSELTGDALYMNQVRARVGLESVTYSLENLQKERRWELAFEGLRWNDLRRWHIAAEALDQQVNVAIYDFAIPSVNIQQSTAGYGGRYNATQGFFPIPQAAIDNSEGLLEQVEGWDGPDAQYEGYQLN